MAGNSKQVMRRKSNVHAPHGDASLHAYGHRLVRQGGAGKVRLLRVATRARLQAVRVQPGHRHLVQAGAEIPQFVLAASIRLHQRRIIECKGVVVEHQGGADQSLLSRLAI
jgi:hypothetical protein